MDGYVALVAVCVALVACYRRRPGWMWVAWAVIVAMDLWLMLSALYKLGPASQIMGCH